MKSHLRTIIIAIAALAAVMPVWARKEPGQKVGAEISETVYDFGNARSDAGSITHTFSIRNNGKKALSIISALPSCGCTVADYDRKPFMPGQEGTVKVKLSLYGQKGEIQKDVKVRLKSASGASEQIVFALKGVVIPAE